MQENDSRYATLSPQYDPWDPIHALHRYGQHRLTSVEFTTTNLCNMRCEHCAVGDALVISEGDHLPIELLLSRLDELEHLETISITGGEPTFHKKSIQNYIIPLLKYARERGLQSQLNSNLTLDYGRYEMIAPHLDIMHISFNYTSAQDFYEVAFARSGHPVSFQVATRLYEQMIDNAQRLSKGGLFVSAESMINYRTHRKMPEIHRFIEEMGCLRHEVHPMYPSDFAKDLPQLSLPEMQQAVTDLLDARNEKIWMLFGTLPFYHCDSDPDVRSWLQRLHSESNVTVRNDPDGRNRLNIDAFNGDVYVTDFAEVPSFGNIQEESLDGIYNRWLNDPLFATVNCHCPAVNCSGPNLLVKDMYYKNIDFRKNKAITK